MKHSPRPVGLPAATRAGAGVLLLALLGGTVARGAWWLAGPSARRLLGCLGTGQPRCLAPDLEGLIVEVCAVALLLAVAWLLAVSALALTSYVVSSWLPVHPLTRGLDRVAAEACPRVVRRALVAALGLALASGLAAPALAAPGSPRPLEQHPLGHRLDGLPIPDRAVGSAGGAMARGVVMSARDHPRVAPPPRARAQTVLVGPGDSLWSITSRLLGPRASEADIAETWPRLARLNADELGADPDVIHPGTPLRVPDPLLPSRQEPS